MLEVGVSAGAIDANDDVLDYENLSNPQKWWKFFFDMER